jgi:hypothetical protein
MISKSKFGVMTFIVAIGLASPAFADPSSVPPLTPVANYGPSNYAPGQTGGGSTGYNHNLTTDYRLKSHHTHAKNHQQQ